MDFQEQLENIQIAIFAGNHGVSNQGISAFPTEVTSQMVENFKNGGAAINQLAQLFNAKLQVYEMDLDLPTNDFIIPSETAAPDPSPSRRSSDMSGFLFSFLSIFLCAYSAET